jgi:hypothetical protein
LGGQVTSLTAKVGTLTTQVSQQAAGGTAAIVAASPADQWTAIVAIWNVFLPCRLRGSVASTSGVASAGRLAAKEWESLAQPADVPSDASALRLPARRPSSSDPFSPSANAFECGELREASAGVGCTFLRQYDDRWRSGPSGGLTARPKALPIDPAADGGRRAVRRLRGLAGVNTHTNWAILAYTADTYQRYATA